MDIPVASAASASSDVSMPLFETEALNASIDRLKAEQKAMKEAKEKLNKDLKNAEKRRTRLKKRARQLSDADLVAVLQMRGSVPTASSSSGGTSSTSAPPSVTASSDAHGENTG